MRRIGWLALLAGFLAGGLSAGIIGTTDTFLSGNTWHEVITFQGFTFTTGESVEIHYPVAQYGALSNGVAQPSNNWSLLLFQPGNPAGADGIYSLQALVNNPSFAGPFSVDFTYLGPGSPNGQHPFNILDSNFNVIDSGITGIPEPSSISILALGALMIGIGYRARRRVRA